MTRLTLVSLFDDMARWGGRPAVTEVRGLRVDRLSYAEIRRRALGLAAALDARGVRPGDRVVLRARAGADWIAAFFGCLHRGAVVVPLDPERPSGFTEAVTHQVSPALLLDDRALAALRIDAPAPPPPAAPRKGDDHAEIIFNSGTTAAPQGVCLTHANLLANIAPVEAEAAKQLKANSRRIDPPPSA